MEKQTFEIPKGCSKVTIEQIGNTIVTTFEAEKTEFKKGDIIYQKGRIFIFSGEYGNSTQYGLHSDGAFTKKNEIGFHLGKKERFATEAEKQQLFDALAKEGIRWDAEKLEIVDLKYIPKVGDCVKVFDGKRLELVGVVYVENKYGYMTGFTGNVISFSVVESVTGRAFNNNCYNFAKITPEELQAEFNKLGYEYNFETHEATKIKWKPKDGEIYYYVSTGCKVIKAKNNNCYGDIELIKIGNCYRTPEDSEKRRQHYLAFKD